MTMPAARFLESPRTLARRSGTWLLVAAVGAALAGCTVGPNFASPELPLVSRYTTPGESIGATVDPKDQIPAQSVALGEHVTDSWWKLFRSPQLDALVKQAIAGNQSLESVRQRLAVAHESVMVARSALYPQIGLGANVEEAKLTSESFGLSPSAFPLPPSFNLFQVGPSASYTPDLFGQTHRRIEQQQALADYQADQLDAAYLALTGKTAAQALQVAAINSQIKALRDILAIVG